MENGNKNAFAVHVSFGLILFVNKHPFLQHIPKNEWFQQVICNHDLVPKYYPIKKYIKNKLKNPKNIICNGWVFEEQFLTNAGEKYNVQK